VIIVNGARLRVYYQYRRLCYLAIGLFVYFRAVTLPRDPLLRTVLGELVSTFTTRES
jgi:hypothetical protein